MVPMQSDSFSPNWAPNGEDAFMTGAQILQQQAAENEATRILLKQLTRRFGQPSNDVVRRVQTATPAQLDTWTDRILDANSVEEVFAG